MFVNLQAYVDVRNSAVFLENVTAMGNIAGGEHQCHNLA